LRVLSVVHQRNAAEGVFAQPARADGHELVEWLPHQAPPPELDGFGAAFVWGSEAHPDQEDRYPWLPAEKRLVAELLKRCIPVLGICFGAELVAGAAGAAVRRAPEPEIGWYEIELTPEGIADPVLGFLPQRFEGFMWHHYESLLPTGAVALARSARCLHGFRLGDRSAWGLQFHPEVTGEDLGAWLDGWENDEDAQGLGFDPEAIRTESRAKIAAWNEVGRAISTRFLREAAEPAT
jgi:GMP synthase (glutamine-hydrolysing)